MGSYQDGEKLTQVRLHFKYVRIMQCTKEAGMALHNAKLFMLL